MKRLLQEPMCLAALAFFMASFGFPLDKAGQFGVLDLHGGTVAVPVLLLVAAGFAWRGVAELRQALILVFAAVIGCVAALRGVHSAGLEGGAGLGFWLFIFGVWALAWRGVAVTAAYHSLHRWRQKSADVLVAALFAMWLVFLWEVVVTAFGVPQVLLPAPSVIAVKFASSLDVLWADFVQTFIRSVILGYIIGCGAGLAVSIMIDRVPFLQRGLLPLGNLVSALPIVGVAPIMVMWFGFDWQSKVAVVVIMTFFPMLVNTVLGLSAAGKLEAELIKSYGASYWQTLLKLRLPAAMPYIFNALKINSTLALIGAVVAEFFGTPVVGMGFRISTEVGRMNVDMVWAEIALAALAGSAFYGALVLVERMVTFWHPSYRQKRA